MPTLNHKPLRVVVLISGRGSNLKALLEKSYQRGWIEISSVISNRPAAGGLALAAAAGIPTSVLDHTLFDTREAFDESLYALVAEQKPELVILAGFMRILTKNFVAPFEGRMFNIHPSLLPKYPGLHTHRRALEHGDSEHGASIHFVTSELDGGPIVMQAKVPILPDDTEDSLAARVLAREHELYPSAVNLFASGRLKLGADGVPQLDHQPLVTPILI